MSKNNPKGAIYNQEAWGLVQLPNASNPNMGTLNAPLFKDKEDAREYARKWNNANSGYLVDIARVLVPLEYITQ